MAKEKPRCVLCGQKTGLFDRCSIHFYRTTQIICSKCLDCYEKSEGPERDALDQRILSSRVLENRDVVRRNYEADQERKRAEEEARLEQERQLQERRERQKSFLRCCDREMKPLGTFTFQLGEHTFFLGDLDNLLSGSLELALFRCECCGQVKFFDPSFVKDASL